MNWTKVISAIIIAFLIFEFAEPFIFKNRHMEKIKKKRIEKALKNYNPPPALSELVEVNPLPDSVNWQETEKFLVDAGHGHMRNSGIIKSFSFDLEWEKKADMCGLSENSKRTIAALTKDLAMFCSICILDENAVQDSQAEFDLLKEFIDVKYHGFSDDMRFEIYNKYLYNNFR